MRIKKTEKLVTINYGPIMNNPYTDLLLLPSVNGVKENSRNETCHNNNIPLVLSTNIPL